MKNFAALFLGWFLISACHGQQQNLTVEDFNHKIMATQPKTLLDVRTPSEYEKGHLLHSVNINWNDSGFAKKVALLDKKLPVYVYCLSGGRSAQAANYLRQNGFGQVYEMEGGMMKWRAANLPEEKNLPATAGISVAQFEKMVQSDKLVLVDFYADWCVPCKKMAPYLKEIERDMKKSVVVLRIDADKNEALASALKVDGLPVLHIYKNGKLAWSHLGFISKKKVVQQLGLL